MLNAAADDIERERLLLPFVFHYFFHLQNKVKLFFTRNISGE
jgi:hypothetical protein